MTKPACIACRYLERDDDFHICRRFPPQVITRTSVVWPVIYRPYVMWCGEYVERDKVGQ